MIKRRISKFPGNMGVGGRLPNAGLDTFRGFIMFQYLEMFIINHILNSSILPLCTSTKIDSGLRIQFGSEIEGELYPNVTFCMDTNFSELCILENQAIKKEVGKQNFIIKCLK